MNTRKKINVESNQHLRVATITIGLSVTLANAVPGVVTKNSYLFITVFSYLMMYIKSTGTVTIKFDCLMKGGNQTINHDMQQGFRASVKPLAL